MHRLGKLYVEFLEFVTEQMMNPYYESRLKPIQILKNQI